MPTPAPLTASRRGCGRPLAALAAPRGARARRALSCGGASCVDRAEPRALRPRHRRADRGRRPRKRHDRAAIRGARPSALTYAVLFLASVPRRARRRARDSAVRRRDAAAPRPPSLTAFGLALNYRLDSGRRRAAGVWVAIGVCVFAAVLIWLRHDYRVLESLPVPLRRRGGRAAAPPVAFRASASASTASGSGCDVGPLQFQPGELAKIFLIVFLAGYLREKREVLAQGRLKDFGPLLAIWGAAMLVLVQTNDLGSALLNFGIFLAMLYVATGRALVRRRGARALRRRRRASSTTRSTASRSESRSGSSRGPTSASTARSTASSSSARTAPRTSSSRACTRSPTAASAAPGSARARSRPPTARS